MTERVFLSHNEIIAIFEGLPAGELLHYAKDVQKRILAGEKLAEVKDDRDPDSWVTVADTWIQGRIIEYFEQSPLGGRYQIIAEEAVGIGGIPAVHVSDTQATTVESPRETPYILVVDPLDGTSPFQKGSDEWGIMIALYSPMIPDPNSSNDGKVEQSRCYSWNLLSDGSLYASYLPSIPEGVATPCNSSDTFKIDHCAYGAEDLDVLKSIVSQAVEINPKNLKISTSPTAVVVGYQLLQRQLDAIVWVASDRGKKIIPVYDLSFLMALSDQQFVIKLGVGEAGITLVVVARSELIANALVSAAGQLPWARLGENRPDSLDSIIFSLKTR